MCKIEVYAGLRWTCDIPSQDQMSMEKLVYKSLIFKKNGFQKPKSKRQIQWLY